MPSRRSAPLLVAVLAGALSLSACVFPDEPAPGSPSNPHELSNEGFGAPGPPPAPGAVPPPAPEPAPEPGAIPPAEPEAPAATGVPAPTAPVAPAPDEPGTP